MVQEAIDAQWQTKNITKSRCPSHQSVGRMEQQMELRWQICTRILISYLGYLGVAKGIASIHIRIVILHHDISHSSRLC